MIEPFQDSIYLIKVISDRNEMEEALKLYSGIAVKKNPLIISLSITSEFYFENYCRFYLDFLVDEGLSVGAFDLKTKKIVCVALSMDLFSKVPKELNLENLHPLMQKEESLCTKGLDDLIKEGRITQKKNHYFYELMAATADGFNHTGVYFKVSMYRIHVMLQKGFKMYYGEITTPIAIRAWMEKIKPNHIKPINLIDFEFNGRKVYDGVDWGKLGFKKGEEFCYCILKEFTKEDLKGSAPKSKI